MNYDRKIIGSFSYTFFIFSNVFEGNMSQYDKQVKYFKQDKEFKNELFENLDFTVVEFGRLGLHKSECWRLFCKLKTTLNH